VVGGSLYNWANFGLEFNAAIDSRLVLEEVFNKLSDFDLAYYQKPFHILTDRELIDNWMQFYFNSFDSNGFDTDNIEPSLQILSILGLFCVYGTLCGALHAICFIAILEFGKSHLEYKKMIIITFWFAFALLYGADYVWAKKQPYSVDFVVCCWIVCLFLVFYWRLCGLKVVSKIALKAE
jgi:hypothetical protein